MEYVFKEATNLKRDEKFLELLDEKQTIKNNHDTTKPEKSNPPVSGGSAPELYGAGLRICGLLTDFPAGRL